MRIRERKTPTAAGPTAETLAERHAEAKIEAERLTSEAESFAGTVQERLREIDGKHALDELDADEAAQLRGIVVSEGDHKTAAAESAKRAADYVLERLIEAAREEADALLAEPLAQHRHAVAKRDATLKLLAEDEEHVTASLAAYREAEKAGQAIRVQHDPAARERDRVERNRRSTAIAWATRQVGSMGIKQLPLEYQVEALAAVEKRNAAAVAGRAAPEGEDSSIAAHEQWPRLGAA